MEAPRHNWKLYEQRKRPSHVEWLQGLTPETGYALFKSLWRLAASLPMSEQEASRLRAQHWQEKLEVRRRQVAAFTSLDSPIS